MINISKNKCVGCGTCIEICPKKAITLNDGVAIINVNKCVGCGLCIKSCPQNAIVKINETLLIAIGSDDKKIIKQDDHVGASKFYLIYKYENGLFDFIEVRKNLKVIENETKIHGDPKKAKNFKLVLKGIDVIVGKLFGPNIVRMQEKFVCVVSREKNIQDVLNVFGKNINEIIEVKNKTDRKGIVLNNC